MRTQRENSTLIALREVRSLETERRRREQRQAEEAIRLRKARAEEAQRASRLAREAEARAREQTQQRWEEARLRDREVVRLQGELSRREQECARLRAERLAQQEALARPPVVISSSLPRTNTFLWIACATAGVLALVLAWRQSESPSMPPPAAPMAMACPAAPSPAIPTPAIIAPIAPLAPMPEKPRPADPRRAIPRRPRLPRSVKKPPPIQAIKCDGTDPLCGLDVQRLADEGKPPARKR